MKNLSTKFNEKFNKLSGLYVKYHDKVDGFLNDCFYTGLQLRLQSEDSKVLQAFQYNKDKFIVEVCNYGKKSSVYQMEINLNDNKVEYFKNGNIPVKESTFNKHFNNMYKHIDSCFNLAGVN